MRPLHPRLLRRARAARVALIVDVALGILAAIAVLSQAILLAGIVTDAFDGDSLAHVSGALALLAGVVVLRGVLVGAFETVGRGAAARAMSDLRLELVQRRLRDAPRASDAAEAGEVAAAAVLGVDALEAYFARYLPQVVLAAVVPVLVLVVAAAVDPTSATIMLVTLPLIPLFMWLIGRATEARTRARWQALSRLANHFLDVVRGLPTLRAFNRGEAQARQIEAMSESYRATTMQVLQVSFLSGAALDLMATLATALVAVTLGIRLVGGGVGLHAALIVLLLVPELYLPLRAMAAQFHASADGLAAAERILALIDATPQGRPGHDGPPESWDVVSLEGVSLANPGRPGKVLDGFDLRIRRGEVVALVGASGAGKSTVASLLLGLRAPDSGRVAVDGHDLQTLDPAAWRRQIGWLPQRPTLFRGTVRDNIGLGEPRPGDPLIEEASRLAGADEFIREQRSSYDTRIGEGGRSLSAGEGRRVALARALARDAPLLILDEPTANLDAESADLIARSIRDVAPGRAILLIEHRPGLAAAADRVVALVDGRSVEVANAAVLA